VENEFESTASTPPSPVAARSYNPSTEPIARTECRSKKTRLVQTTREASGSRGQTKEVLLYFLTCVLLLVNTDYLFLTYDQDCKDNLLIFIATAGI
jgi:hypothetical protein